VELARLTLTTTLLVSCTDPAIEMSLAFSEPQTTFDLSCVTTVSVTAIGNDRGDIETGKPPDYNEKCIDVGGLSNFADVRRAMRDRFDISLPDSGLAAIHLRGSVGACDESSRYHEAVFYGGAPASSDSITIPVAANLSCNVRTSLSIKPIDLLALVRTRQCNSVAGGRAFGGNIRPLLLGPTFPRTTFEIGTSSSSVWTNGVSVVASFSRATSPTTCVSVGYDNTAISGGRCAETPGPSLCAGPGEIEVPVLPADYLGQSIDPTLYAAYGQPVVGAVFEVGSAASKVPVQGATVQLDAGTQGKVVYVDRSDTRFVARTGAATGPEGLFLVYLKGEPTSITVASPLHATQAYRVASAAGFPSTLIATIPRR
jgi:hypothetical protein